MAELAQKCRLLSTELTELRQSLAAEHQHRTHAEELLRQAQDQLVMQQQLTARTGEQVSLASAGDLATAHTGDWTSECSIKLQMEVDR